MKQGTQSVCGRAVRPNSFSVASATIAKGDPIVWLRAPRHGYCLPDRVLAKFVRVSRDKITIDALLRDENTWKRVSVKEENLRLPTDGEKVRIGAAILGGGKDPRE